MTRRLIAITLCSFVLAYSGKPSQSSAQEFVPVPDASHQSDLAAFPARAGYKVIAGPRIIDQVTHKSPYDHLPIEAKVPQPYAYGWFGGTNNQKWTRQFGYARRHTQWTLK